jgi:hypothetical protein
MLDGCDEGWLLGILDGRDDGILLGWLLGMLDGCDEG